MSVQASMTEAQVLTVLRSFLLSVVPSGVEVIRGEVNRVPEPAGADYIIMWPLDRPRLSTNVVSYFDDPAAQAYTSVSQIKTEVSTAIDAETGLGILSEPVTLYRPGQRNALQPTKMTVQVDVHGPASADNVQTISTLFRDDYACRLFRNGPDLFAESASTIDTEVPTAIQTEGIDAQPLYCSEPRQAPFTNAENQTEFRWTIDLTLQANIVITTPQDFAGAVSVGIINVEATYPPGDN